MRKLPVRFSSCSNKLVVLDGGLDTDNVRLGIKPGKFTTGFNHEMDDQVGYRRIDGYERVDGAWVPSEAEPLMLSGTFVGYVAAHDIVVGDISGAAGIVLEDYGPTSPALSIIQAGATKFVDGEDVLFGGSPVINNITVGLTGINKERYDELCDLAVSFARNLVDSPPGDGNIVGIAQFDGRLYCFRDDAASGCCIVSRSSNTGAWITLDDPIIQKFTSGHGTKPAVGDTVTSSSGSATIVNVQALTGSWSAGTAAGVLTIDNEVFHNSDSLIFSSGGGATADGDSETIKRALGGHVDSIIYNFTGDADDKALWLVDGKNLPVKIKGDTIYPIYTGLENTGIYPAIIVAHHHHLFLSYGDNWVFSGIGDPFLPWTALSGADQWGMGDEIVGAIITPSGTMVSFCQNRIDVVYGDSAANFQVKTYSDKYGARKHTVQSAVAPVFMSKEGNISLMITTQKWGDFALDTIDQSIRSFLSKNVGEVTCSTVNLKKLEYRLYFEMKCVRVKFSKSGRLRGFTVDNYNKTVDVITVGDDGHIYFASNGSDYVYRMDSGPTFDCELIFAYLKLAPEHFGMPRVKKRFYESVVEVEPEGSNVEVYFRDDYSLYRTRSALPDQKNISSVNGNVWDTARWNKAFWSVGNNQTEFFSLRHRATACAVSTSVISNTKHSYTVKTINRRFAKRGLERR